MKKLKYLIKYSLKKRIFSKAFVISTAIIGVVILLVTLLPTIVTMFAGDDQGLIDDKITIVNHSTYDSGNTDIALYLENGIKNQLIAIGFDFQATFEVITTGDAPNASYYDQDNEAKGLIYIYREAIDPLGDLNDPDNYLLKLDVYNEGINEYIFNQLMFVSKDLQRVKYNFDHQASNPDLVGDLTPSLIINPNDDVNGVNELLMAMAPMLIIPIFILITFAVQVIGADIIEEKSTKAIEIIIASVKPQTHFIAKILAVIIFQLIQMSLYFGFGIIGVLLNEVISGGGASEGSWNVLIGSSSASVIPTFALVFICAILGATIYAVIGAFFASLAVNQEDYQQIQTPVMMLLMFAYMGTLMAGIFESKAILLVFAYIPFFSPLVLPVLVAMGSITTLEVIIGLVILVVSILLLILLISPLYRASILSYDQSSVFKRIKNTYKSSKAMRLNQKAYEEQNIE